MKTKFIFGILIVFLLFTISFALAQTNSEKVDDAYTCLENKIINKKCSGLSTEEQIFSLMAIGKCKSEVKSVLEKNVKTTSQAILALNEINVDTDNAETWLQIQTKVPLELIWYLQIESSEPTTCKISYDNKEHTITIDEDKKISSRAGTCLSLSPGDYWLEVEPTCYDKKFTISCNEQFSTNLLYKKQDSTTIYIPGEINSASADGQTQEKVNSLCFKKDSHCDYESTLWAALALDKKELDTYYYLPYLISMADENKNYLPESFLYLLTEEENYKKNLEQKQNPAGYWEESPNKYYDTALALYALQKDESQQKSDAKKWLLKVQNDDGCWKGITETAFILYAAFPKGTDIVVDEDEKEPEEPKEDKKPKDDKDDDKTTTTNDDEKNIFSYWYIWVLVFLIILTIIGIIFRDKIRPYWFRLKYKFGGGGPRPSQGPTPPGFLPPGTPQQRLMPRRILPSRPSPTPRRSISPRPKTEKDKEFSDVLKKLKEIGS